jgi:hypothetical protein
MRWRRRYWRLCANIWCFFVFLVAWLCDSIAGYATTIAFTILFTAFGIFPYLFRVLRALATTGLMTFQTRLLLALGALVLLPPWLFLSRLGFSLPRINRACKQSLSRIRCTAIVVRGVFVSIESVQRLNPDGKALAVRIRRALTTRSGPIDIDVLRLATAVVVGVPTFLAILTPVIVLVTLAAGPRALFRHWRVSRNRCKAWLVPLTLVACSPLFLLGSLFFIAGLAISRVYWFGLRRAVMLALFHQSRQFYLAMVNIGDYDTQMKYAKYGPEGPGPDDLEMGVQPGPDQFL